MQCYTLLGDHSYCGLQSRTASCTNFTVSPIVRPGSPPQINTSHSLLEDSLDRKKITNKKLGRKRGFQSGFNLVYFRYLLPGNTDGSSASTSTVFSSQQYLHPHSATTFRRHLELWLALDLVCFCCLHDRISTEGTAYRPSFLHVIFTSLLSSSSLSTNT